jgi:hypothetical protein
MSLLVGPSKAQPPWQTKGDRMIRDTRLHTRLVLGLGTAAILLLGSGSIAHAQYQSPPPAYNAPPPGYGGYPPPPPPPPPRSGMYRSGLVLGLGIGLGNISAQNCGDICGVGFAGEFHIGVMLNPRLALMGDFLLDTHSIPNSDGTLVNTVYTIAAQYWVTDFVWLKGGVGGANIQIQSKSSNLVYTDESGLGLMGGAGVEVLQMGNFALDLQLRLSHGFYSIDGDATTAAFLVGFNWY